MERNGAEWNETEWNGAEQNETKALFSAPPSHAFLCLVCVVASVGGCLCRFGDLLLFWMLLERVWCVDVPCWR